LKLWGVLAYAAAGALLGDGIAYLVGHLRQREILSTWPLANYPGVVAQSEAFFNRWGALAVFFARFVPPFRAFVPVTAGALAMSPLRFFSINIPAVLLWAPRACVCPACWRFPRCMNTPDCRIMSILASICGCSRCLAAA